jgi:hypothetical protein
MRKYLLAAAMLAISGSANAQDAFDRGFDQGYQAVHPSLLYSPQLVRPLAHPIPRFGQSEFQAGIAAGVERGQEDNRDEDN